MPAPEAVVVPSVPDSATPMLLEAVITAGHRRCNGAKSGVRGAGGGATPDFASRQQAIRRRLLAAATVSSNPFIQQLLVEQLLANLPKRRQGRRQLSDRLLYQMEEKEAEQRRQYSPCRYQRPLLEILANPQAFDADKYRRHGLPPGVYPLRRAPSAMHGFNASQDYLFAESFTSRSAGPPLAAYIQSIICRAGTSDISELKAFSRWLEVVITA